MLMVMMMMMMTRRKRRRMVGVSGVISVCVTQCRTQEMVRAIPWETGMMQCNVMIGMMIYHYHAAFDFLKLDIFQHSFIEFCRKLHTK